MTVNKRLSLFWLTPTVTYIALIVWGLIYGSDPTLYVNIPMCMLTGSASIFYFTKKDY